MYKAETRATTIKQHSLRPINLAIKSPVSTSYPLVKMDEALHIYHQFHPNVQLYLTVHQNEFGPFKHDTAKVAELIWMESLVQLDYSELTQ